MKQKSNTRVTRGMIFAGCSFTWGQGLYYYSNLPTLDEPPPDCYYPQLVTDLHIEHAKSVRYPRIVANYFKSFELVTPYNGGSCDSVIEWWEKSFAPKEEKISSSWNSMPTPHYNYSEISHIVFQLTQWARNSFKMQVNGKDYIIENYKVYTPDFIIDTEKDISVSEIFEQWIKENNITLDEWENNSKHMCLNSVRKFLQKMEQNGIHTTLFSWPADLVPLIKQDAWLCKRFMNFEYNNHIYNNIEHMMKANRELVIKYDYDNFIEPPKDHHPSLKCHQVMAENVIKHLEKNI